MNKPNTKPSADLPLVSMTVKIMRNRELFVDHPFGEDAEKAAITLLMACASAFKATRRLKSYGIHLTDIFRDITQMMKP